MSTSPRPAGATTETVSSQDHAVAGLALNQDPQRNGHASGSESSSGSELLVSSSDSSQKKQPALDDPARVLQEDDKTYYNELLKEDSEEHAFFMARVQHEAEDIRLARQMLRGARKLSNHRARPHHQKSCPETAETEPPLEFHHIAAQEHAHAMHGDSRENHVRFSHERQEATDEDMIDPSASDDDSEGSESASYLSSLSGMREPDDPAHRPSVRPTGQHSSSEHATDFSSNRTGQQPWAYRSMYITARSARGLEDPLDTPAHISDMARDQEVSYEDFQLGSRKLLEELVSPSNISGSPCMLTWCMQSIAQPSLGRLFRRYFNNIMQMYTPTLWPALRLYDIRIRSTHLGDTSTDLLYFDRRLLGTILIEEADELFEGLHLTHPQNVSYDAPPNVKADESRRASRATPNLQQEHELARFLEDTYRGAGPYARDFLSLGVTSATSFAEAAMVDPEAIDDLIDAARNKTEGVMSSYLAIMLKKLLKRRFGQSDRPLMALAHTSSLR